MRRLILLLSLCLVTLWAATADTLKIRIMESLAQLVTGKSIPAVYVDTAKGFDTTADISGMHIVFTCENAEVLFSDDVGALLKRCRIRPDQMVFALSYRDFLSHKEWITGAFFWQKGRPNIILNGKALKARQIEIPQRYQKYVE